MNRTEYIGKLNALYVGEKNCLEELITAYDEKDKEIERLNNIINELEKWFENMNIEKLATFDDYDIGQYNAYKKVIDKLQELKGSDKE